MQSELLGLPLTITTRRAAIESLTALLAAPGEHASEWVSFMNAHNFNVAMEDADYRDALRSARAVYMDGLAIRFAARLFGIPVLGNLPGTDLVPELLMSAEGGRVFLLGDTPANVERAASELERQFPGWSVVGFASGFLATSEAERSVVKRIKDSRADLLLIGMGASRQERFAERYGAELGVPLCVCVGGLFAYWSKELVRAPRIVRALCLEWLWILLQQPHKLRRYTIGSARFFASIARARLRPCRVAVSGRYAGTDKALG